MGLRGVNLRDPAPAGCDMRAQRRPPRATARTVTRQAALLAAALLAALPAPVAGAEQVVYRFEAERIHVEGSPPLGSVTARAAALPGIAGSFGFTPGVAPQTGAAIPGRVAFALYATGFVAVSGLDLDGLPDVLLRVGDATPRPGDPAAFRDDLILSTDSGAGDAPVDAFSLTLRYRDAGALEGVAIPGSIDTGELGSMTITFSTFVPATGDRPRQDTGSDGILGLATFRITRLERAE